MAPKITDEMREALLHQGSPIEVEDDATHQMYLLVARDEFRRRVQETLADPEQLKAAILARRDESRELNADWEHVDRDVWEADSSTNV